MSCECGFLLKSQTWESNTPLHDEAPQGHYATFCADSKTKTPTMAITTTKTTTTCGGRVTAPNLARRRPEWCSESRRAKCSESCPSTPRMVPESRIYCSKQDRTQFTQLSGHLSGDVKLASFGGILGGSPARTGGPCAWGPTGPESRHGSRENEARVSQGPTKRCGILKSIPQRERNLAQKHHRRTQSATPNITKFTDDSLGALFNPTYMHLRMDM